MLNPKQFGILGSPAIPNPQKVGMSSKVIKGPAQQVADQLGFKVASIYALLSRHELAALKVGRNRVITQEQLNDYLARRKSSDAVIDYTK